MTRRLTTLTVALVAAAMLVFVASASSRTTKCNVGAGKGYGYSYLTSLSVNGVSCSTGSYVAKKHGHVRGWRCRQKRLDTSSFQYDERVSCASGRHSVVWTYTQNT
jgi:hypothetical protein